MMEGRTLTHYRVMTHLGGGGMGVVYKAEDSRLRRPVALKFLPPELTRDTEARERFVQEAQAASLLDHPNICTIYEIDTTEDGQLFIAMAYIDGETVKKKLRRGPLPVAEAVDIAIQVGRGLEKAHHAGIVHRDIKPANIMVTIDGLVKLVDFGIAKLLNHTGPTRTGTTLGTVAYMAPEQLNGAATDQRCDIWGAGVVLYEMLAGRLPFAGDHELAIINNIVNQPPKPITTLRAEVPEGLQSIVNRALAKRPEDRYLHAGEFVQDLVRAQGPLTGQLTATRTHPVVSRRLALSIIVIATLLAAAPAAWLIKRNADARRIDAMMAAATAFADHDDNVSALAQVEAIERVAPADPRLAPLLNRIAIERRVNTNPEGAQVLFKGYGDVSRPWKSLGVAPIERARLPLGTLRWKLEKPGFATREFIGPAILANNPIGLFPASAVPDDMVMIPRSGLNLPLSGYNYTRQIPAGGFLIDKHEVTNQKFKTFVDAGGYSKPEYWKQPFVKDTYTLTWREGVTQLVDRTGRPGPSTWEVGTYPQGEDNYPVRGVSWYEAAAYAEFVGKSLPTVYHWLRAAGTGAAAYITPLSNLDGKGPAPVGTFQGVTPAGAFDMAGNVKEWCWNELPPAGFRYLLGGAWSDPAHLFLYADGRTPFDRSETNGFRLVKYLEGSPSEALTRAISSPIRDATKIRPAPDDVYGALRAMYAYDPRPLEAQTESTENGSLWTREKVSFRAAYGDERMTAFLFLPKNRQPPYNTLVFMPGAGTIQGRSNDLVQSAPIDYLMVSGRAVIYPVYKGTYERNTGQVSVWPEPTRAYEDWLVQVVNDARRAIDYLATRGDIQLNSLAFYGISWGGRLGPQVLALEPRVKSAVLIDGGLSQGNPSPVVDSLHFAPRVTVPVLMINGDSDFIYPIDSAQKPLFDLLGTPAAQKRHVILRSGHGTSNQQRSQVVREVLDWLDRYQGSVEH